MIPLPEPQIGNEELDCVVEAVKSGWVSSKGKFVLEFENLFAKYCNVKYGVATSNGTVALHLALAALGIKEGDEVIIPALTFIATANAVKYTGAKPVLIDSHPEYWCLDPGKIEKAVTSKTKAIIPVHLYGHPCDMDPILAIAKKHNLYVIEDAAEAHGAEYKGKKVGSFSTISCFSFYGNKIITTGEGGICLTENADLAERMRIMRDHGMNPGKRYWHDIIGFNYRMTNLQAALGVAQIRRIDKFIAFRKEIENSYNKLLKNVKGIRIPPKMPWAKSVCWLYSILLEKEFGRSKENLMLRLAEEKIETRPFFYPVNQMPPYFTNDRFPIAEELSLKGLNLPTNLNLRQADIDKIASIISNPADR